MGAAVTRAVTAAVRPRGKALLSRHSALTDVSGAPYQGDVYKALSLAAYGGEKEEAGGLLSKSEKPAGSPFPGTVQASRPSREGPIIAMRMQLSQATQRRKR